MRVLHVIDSLRSAEGGPSFAVRELVRHLAATGVELDLLFRLGDEGQLQEAGWPKGVRLTQLAGQRLRPPIGRRSSAIADLVAAADMVHIHGIWDALVIEAGSVARHAGKPVACTPRGMLSPWSMARHRVRKWPFYRLFTRPMIKNAAALHFITQAERDLAGEWTPAGKLTFVVPNILAGTFYESLPPRDEALRLFPQIPCAGPWVLFLSRIHLKKGLPRLIRAFPAVLKAFPTAQLLIAGTGSPPYVREMVELAATTGIGSSTHFLGLVQGAAKVALYRRAAILAVPSSQENFGMVFAESLACETPVLLTPQVDLHHEIMAVGAGFLTEATPTAVAEKLSAALGDPGRLLAAGAAGRRWALEHLQPARVAAAMIENYEKILSRAAPSAEPR